MTLVEHIGELRSRLFKSVLAVVVTTAAAFSFHDRVLHFLTRPYCNLPEAHRLSGGESCSLIVTGVLEGFNVSLRVSLYVGIIAAAPIWLYQVWRFITPGLHKNERRWGLAFVAASTLLFSAGAALAYLMLGKGLKFMLSFASGGLTPALKIDSYLSFISTAAVAFGLGFEFPVLLVLLNLSGVLSFVRMRSWWRGVILGIFIFAAVATPSGDPFTMTAMATPMVVMYGVALLVSRAHDRRKARRQADSPYAGLADDETSPLEYERT